MKDKVVTWFKGLEPIQKTAVIGFGILILIGIIGSIIGYVTGG